MFPNRKSLSRSSVLFRSVLFEIDRETKKRETLTNDDWRTESIRWYKLFFETFPCSRSRRKKRYGIVTRLSHRKDPCSRRAPLLLLVQRKGKLPGAKGREGHVARQLGVNGGNICNIFSTHAVKKRRWAGNLTRLYSQ